MPTDTITIIIPHCTVRPRNRNGGYLCLDGKPFIVDPLTCTTCTHVHASKAKKEGEK
jgi:hypothetical protein